VTASISGRIIGQSGRGDRRRTRPARPTEDHRIFLVRGSGDIFDTLVQPDADLEMRPALAESWTVSPDQLAWMFHLRRGVTFQDGSPFTADDVVYSHRRIIDEKPANADKLSAVSGITTPDKSTVIISLKQPTPNLLTNLGGFKGLAIV
jgi:peptide/nickel transport system substrate-binding protein